MDTQIKQQSTSSNQKFLFNQIYKIKQPSKDVAMKIIEQIEQGKLSICQQQKPLIRGKKVLSQADLQGRSLKMIEQIRKNKQRTLMQLTSLEQKEEEVKKALRQLNKSAVGIRKQRSSFSPQQKQKIKQILKLASLKQKKNKEKDKLIFETYTNYLKKQRQEDEQLVQKLRYEHQKAVQQNLLNIQLRRKRRQESQKIVGQRILQLKKKRYIHIQNQRLDQSQKEQQKIKIEQKLLDLKKRFKLDFYQIRQHEKSYEKNLQQKSLKRTKKHKTQISRQNSTCRKYSKNMFSRILEDEQRQKKKNQIEKVNKPKQMKIKVNQFQAYIKQHYRPKRSIQSVSHMSQNQKSQKNPLSYQQRSAQGNAYLKLARKLRKQKDDPKITQKPQLVKYVNYLKQFNQSQKKAKNIQKFKSLIKTQQSLDYSSAAQAASLVEQMQKRSKKGVDQKLFQSIQNKIDLLKVLI